jgi:4-amino-4-deoxy-L-arabinose transferase-like glycosyltransferase
VSRPDTAVAAPGVPEPRDGPGRPPGRWPARRTVAIGAGVVLAATLLVRLPLLRLPLDPDEGGYAYIAQRWADGARLYSPQAWVDRPQGLMVLFRAVGTVSYSALAIRAAAVLVACVLALAVAAIAWAVVARTARGPVAAAVAAGTAVVLGAGSLVEGYQLNGELAASAVGCAGLAVGWWWRVGRLRTGWLLAAGALCGAALLMKQSAVDALVVLVVLVATARRWRPALLAVAGMVVAVGAAVVHAAITGWSDWWYAVVQFQRAVAASQPLGGRWDGVRHVAWHVAPELAGAAVVAVVALVLLRRRDVAGSAWWALLVWPLVALVAIVSGPYAHPHYWVQGVAPLAVLVGAAVALVPRRVGIALTAVALALPLVLLAVLSVRSPERRTATVVTDHRLLVNDQVSAWLRAHSSPDDRVYAFVASADMYLLADRLTGYPYLWQANVEHIPGARDRLAQYLSGAQAPRYVVVYQKPTDAGIDPDGVLAPILQWQYRPVATVGGYQILEHQ